MIETGDFGFLRHIMRRFVTRYFSSGFLCRVVRNNRILIFVFLLLLIILFASSRNTSVVTLPSQEKHASPQTQVVVGTDLRRDALSKEDNNIKRSSDMAIDISLKNNDDGKQRHTPGVKRPKPCYDVHIFYYPWYGSVKDNQHYIHWNHKYLPHWSPEISKLYPSGAHTPPDDIASNFYPELGAYSSSNFNVIRNHMQQLSFSRVGVIAVSYYPPGMADDNGEDWQSIFPLLLKAADMYKIKVAFHIEPYKGRSEETVKNDIEHIIDTYSSHPAFYRSSFKNKFLPLIYIYDSYHTQPSAWAKILKPGFDSIRGTEYDSIVIGLVVEHKHLADMVRAGFDGFYTYFASTGFTYGSSRENWLSFKNFALKNNLLYIPSVGPGYVDTRVRPWNDGNTRKRMKGQYYKESWKQALRVEPEIISITSFNEWHEGTQIERAIPKTIENYKYLDYAPKNPNYYLILTKKSINLFLEMKKKHIPLP